MKILHTVESYYPEIGGMAEVVRQISERLTKLGHDVTVATKKTAHTRAGKINGVTIREFNVDGNLVRGITGDAESYKEFLLNTDADVMVNFAAQQWATDIALPLLDRIKARKVFVPTGFSGFYQKEYKEYFENMKAWMKVYDANVFLSDDYRDINFARNNGINKNYIIPNGAAEDEFEATDIDIRKKLGISQDVFLILHVGSYTTIKGHREALEIYLRSKLKNSVLLFIGFHNDHFEKVVKGWKRNKFREWWGKVNNRRFIITQLSRAETVAAYKAADMFLFPSNVECSPIVLFEAMASETPFLATDVGNSKEIVSWSNGGIILPTTFDNAGYSHANIDASVRILNDMYEDKQQRKGLGQQGYKAWKEGFTWEKITGKYENLYKELLNTTT